ncbi:C-X-C chemokine receptor type 3.1 isoform 1-T2 [Odontesthes bonariensis]|uniref:C-X-C chemokine receptor type 3.1 n=1 Tax=Odontesthes bonariensis TaxID=219752 RepID=UPI003F58CA79
MDMMSFVNLSENYSYDADYDYSINDEICDLTEGTNFGAVLIPVMYSVAFVVGVLGNGALLGVLFQSRKSWSVTDTFILHLGVADILLLVTLPLYAVQSVQKDGWTFGAHLCKMTGTVFTINFYCGIFLLACISMDRYLSIVHATQMYSRRKPWVVHVSCLMVWFFSLLLSILDWIFLDVVLDERRHRNECVRDYSKFGNEGIRYWHVTSRLIYHIVGFLLPSLILIICYSCILWKLRCGGTQGLQKQRAFKVIISLVVVFFLCWTPYNITLVVDTSCQYYNTNICGIRITLGKAIAVTSSLGYLHCSLNPILYAFVGIKFRRQLLEILRSLGCKMKTSTKFQSVVSRRTSLWSDSADTSNSIAV